MRIKIYATSVVMVVFLIGCGEDPNPGSGGNPFSPTDWLIPSDRVFDGGPGKDGIPALESPHLVSSSSASFISDNELVIGYKWGDQIRAYPHLILDYHEIVNDQIDNHAYAITYCPLTGTGINWGRTLNGVTTSFGVSGLLYNSNLIPYDRETDSNWSQMRLECVNGALIGEKADIFMTVETTWATWKNLYPETMVMSLNTGFARPYGTYPYFTSKGDYRVADYLIFPVDNLDSRLSRKERVHGIVAADGSVRVYRFDQFEPSRSLIIDNFDGKNIVVVGSRPENWIVSFYLDDQQTLELFDSSSNPLDTRILMDGSGNVYDIFGNATSGPDIGNRLTPTGGYIGYWFAWSAFYSPSEIFGG